MNDLTVLEDLQSLIGTDKIDFSVFAKRKQPLKKSFGMILFGLAWSAFTSIFVFVFIGPLIKGEEVHFKTNGVQTTASLANFQPMLAPTIFVGIFVLVGIVLLFSGFYSLYQKGGYFVGTNNRLIQYNNGNISTYDWEQFSGNMEINNLKGDISLQLRSGKMVHRKNKPAEFVPDIVYISGVANVLDIEKNCSKRIKENDPTQANEI